MDKICSSFFVVSSKGMKIILNFGRKTYRIIDEHKQIDSLFSDAKMIVPLKARLTYNYKAIDKIYQNNFKVTKKGMLT